MTKKFPINVSIKAFLAPLSGVTDLAFRMMCLKYGAGMVTIPMINSNAIVRNNKATFRLLNTISIERPKSVQLFGSRIDSISKACKTVVKATNCEMIDFNMGCPDKNIVSQGAGGALLVRPKKIKEIVETLKSVSDVPISVKIRIGTTGNKINAIRNSQIIAESGADMLIVHGRTLSQGYSGKANWNIIKEISKIINTPVVGSGDIWSYQDAVKIIKSKSCDAIMIGRGALGRPFIFEQIKSSINRKIVKKDYNPLVEFRKYQIQSLKYNQKFDTIKQHAIYFTKGIPNSALIRKKLNQSKDINELNKIMNQSE